MQGNLLAGRRGDVLWHNPKIAGTGQRRDYDTYEAWGWHYPIGLGRPIHVFDIGQMSATAPAIPLRTDRGFGASAFAQEWVGLVLTVSALATPVLPLIAAFKKFEGKPDWLLYAVLSAVSAALLVAGIIEFFRQKRLDGRHRDIRLLLGTHEWGSSDPAYWPTEVHSHLAGPKASGSDSFAALARRAIRDRACSKAIWAARLCCGVENLADGEKLTDEILNAPDVRLLLARLRANPAERNSALAEGVSLSTWFTEVPGDLVFERMLTG